MNKNVICVSEEDVYKSRYVTLLCEVICMYVCVCLWPEFTPPSLLTHTHTHSSKRTVRGMCAAIELTQSHNPRAVWNVSSCCQWLKPTLVEQLRYTVSGRVLSLPIRIKRRPLRRWKQEERERTSRTAALSETQGAAHTLAVFNVKKRFYWGVKTGWICFLVITVTKDK